MADEIYINTGTSFQQPYQGQAVVNAQSPETKRTPARTPANARQPNTYQHRQPGTYQNPVSAQEPNIRNAQQPFTYNLRSPFTYQHRSPFTYQATGASPYIANGQNPFTYQNPTNKQSPYIANARQPGTYRNPTSKQSPYIANAQQPYPYIANARQPVIYNYRQPASYNYRSPFTYQVSYRAPAIGTQPVIARQPANYTYQAMEEGWGPAAGSYWDTNSSIASSVYGPEAFAQMNFALDTSNDRVIVKWSGGTSAAMQTVYTDYIGYLSPVTDSSTFEVRYNVTSQACSGKDCSSSYCYSASGPLPTNNNLNSGTYYSVPTSPGARQFLWKACTTPNGNNPEGTTNVTAMGISFDVRATVGSATYVTSYSHGSLSLSSTYGTQSEL